MQQDKRNTEKDTSHSISDTSHTIPQEQAIKIRTEGLPPEMQILLDDYPRDAWDDHPNFAKATQHWLGAHQMFRQLSSITSAKLERLIDKKTDHDEFSGQFSYYGGVLVRNLHGHHHWEDHSFFPELSRADSRFDAGLEILESDHEVLDETLHDFTRLGNRLLTRIHMHDDEDQILKDTGRLHGISKGIEALLSRHLTDEEELVVPIILHHKLRG